MNIIVCMKSVPDTTTKVKVGADAKTLDAAGVQYVINPFDEYAVEEALRLKEAAKGAGEITVLTLGAANASKEIRTALAMGADRGILLKETAAWRDGFATAKILASHISKLAYDLILFGKQAVDQDQGQVGAMVATLLGIPAVTEVVKIEMGTGMAVVHREAEGGKEIFEVPLPCALTAQKGLNEPRLTSMKGIMAAKKKPLEEVAFEDVPGKLRLEKMELPAPRPPGRIVGQGKDAVPELVRLLHEEAKVI
ncbi:MAG: electron transfer flavoprotein subunit beta/FixA family protein [Planctomycetota bacterium]